MNLVMLDIDGTLTQSYDYDREVFGQVIGEVLGRPPIDADLNGYVNKTSLGVTEEAIRRLTGMEAGVREIEAVKRKVLVRFEQLYRDSPALFSEVPGASRFLEQLRSHDGVGIAVATGCWHAEALFKLRASGLSIAGLPIASSDDSRDRKEIMMIAVNKAQHTLGCAGFEHVVYLGDGAWDLQFSRSLGYDFIGIGPRIQALQHTESIRWHPDYLEPGAVFASIAAAFLQL